MPVGGNYRAKHELSLVLPYQWEAITEQNTNCLWSYHTSGRQLQSQVSFLILNTIHNQLRSILLFVVHPFVYIILSIFSLYVTSFHMRTTRCTMLKPSATVHTLVWFFCTVHTHMAYQVLLISESTATLKTLVPTYHMDCTDVCTHGLPVLERLLAVSARVCCACTVCLHMLVQAAVVTETLMTLGTLVRQLSWNIHWWTGVSFEFLCWSQ